MISVIIPVYNVEPYLRRCLDSVVNQTYKELEIFIIDDGSTDGSGAICDEYVKADKRIRVFHTENRGLSCARNLGLDEAKGEWIGFVDSDDWIEPDMYECLLRRAEETGADVVECGFYREYINKTIERNRQSSLTSGSDAVNALLHGQLSNSVWNKLWRRECFYGARFPEGRLFEDVVTTYQIFHSADYVSSLEEIKYHYRQRKNSLSNKHEMRNLTDFWLAHKERYERLKTKNEEMAKREIRFCAFAIARTWAHYEDCRQEDKECLDKVVQEMNSFTRSKIPLLGYKGWKLRLRFGIFFPHFLHASSFRIAWLINSGVSGIRRFNHVGLLYG